MLYVPPLLPPSASFESWRKEQQKAFQEKKINPERRKDDFDISELQVDSKDDKGLQNKSKESVERMPASNIDSEKSSLPSQIPASRPLVPPGFASAILERNSGTKTSLHSHSSQVNITFFFEFKKKKPYNVIWTFWCVIWIGSVNHLSQIFFHSCHCMILNGYHYLTMYWLLPVLFLYEPYH